jgi:hypothetical protein
MKEDFTVLGYIFIAFIVTMGIFILLACAKAPIRDCNFVCPKGAAVPEDCYCIEDEIERETRTWK